MNDLELELLKLRGVSSKSQSNTFNVEQVLLAVSVASSQTLFNDLQKQAEQVRDSRLCRENKYIIWNSYEETIDAAPEESAISHAAGIADIVHRFKEYIYSLPDGQALEEVLKSAKEITSKAPLGIHEYISVMLALPETVRQDYSRLVSNVFSAQDSFGMALVCMPRRQPREDYYSLLIASVDRKDPIEEEKEFLRKSFFSEQSALPREANNYFSSNKQTYSSYCAETATAFEIKKTNLEKIIKEDYSSLFDGKTKPEQHVLDPLFVSPKLKLFKILSDLIRPGLSSKYKKPDTNLAEMWIRASNELYEQSPVDAEDFVFNSIDAVRSFGFSPIDPVRSYAGVGCTFDKFMQDFKQFGRGIFQIHKFVDHYSGLGADRLRSVIELLINDNDRETYDFLQNCPLSRDDVGLVASKLPANIDNNKLIYAILATGRVYAKCQSANINPKIVAKRIMPIPDRSTVEHYVSGLWLAEKFAEQYIEFAKEQKGSSDLNFWFDDTKAQKTLDIYLEFLEKDFEQFKRDFRIIGNSLQELPDIYEFYSNFFGATKMKQLLNYVCKKRSKDLITRLSREKAPADVIRVLAKRLEPTTSKENTIKLLTRLNSTYFLLNAMGNASRLNSCLQGQDSLDYEKANAILNNIMKEAYSCIVGDREVPEPLAEGIGNLAVSFYANGSKPHIQEGLRIIAQTYLDAGAESAFEALSSLDANLRLKGIEPAKKEGRSGLVGLLQRVSASIKKQVVQEQIPDPAIGKYEVGIERRYLLSTNGQEIERIKERLQNELNEIYTHMQELGFEARALEELQTYDIKMQVESVEKVLSKAERPEHKKQLKQDIKDHIQTIRSNNGRIREASDEVRFYVCRDPLESLHMGTYFGSCLSFGKSNDYASVVHTVDSNKNVIYGKASNGEVIARNRTVLTDEGILTTKFYQKGHLFMDEAWVNYLADYATTVGVPVHIPDTFVTREMKSLLEERIATGLVGRGQGNLILRPAHFKEWYSDGLSTTSKPDGSISISFSGYVIQPAGAQPNST